MSHHGFLQLLAGCITKAFGPSPLPFHTCVSKLETAGSFAWDEPRKSGHVEHACYVGNGCGDMQ